MISILNTYEAVELEKVSLWFKAAPVEKFPENGGACVKYKGMQIAVFNFTREGTWYACQNLCPHKMEMVLSRGMIGEDQGEPKVACPLHKNSFSLKTGKHLNGDLNSIATYPVKIENDFVYIGFSE
ncbi:nitrite reductase small subunit NirD [Arenibacter algicola]|uniref:Naphthalene 1,2-dioxygenase/salicylate 5-hydroxylase system, ferredoxin component n=1 Tax=Arenibacter algicola TaxID=616991 RepID=A0A221V173_9FLAO|nr:nitrite reductase small subunit NirD [Arenibacter algicola]ASO07367.1 naphthalene 1,2-dioxygenase/salicylate 5-hydroxylase system, ferredoxin component [Arenibacter algicola]|tara:strand:- start:5116 stop:5493 length:378 start_codon:yes stop_codon:yes gene_type:complete